MICKDSLSELKQSLYRTLKEIAEKYQCRDTKSCVHISRDVACNVSTQNIHLIDVEFDQKEKNIGNWIVEKLT